jgi:hypothetical protein
MMHPVFDGDKRGPSLPTDDWKGMFPYLYFEIL